MSGKLQCVVSRMTGGKNGKSITKWGKPKAREDTGVHHQGERGVNEGLKKR